MYNRPADLNSYIYKFGYFANQKLCSVIEQGANSKLLIAQPNTL